MEFILFWTAKERRSQDYTRCSRWLCNPIMVVRYAFGTLLVNLGKNLVSEPIRGRPLIIWGGVVQNGKKNLVRRVAEKKNSVQGPSKNPS